MGAGEREEGMGGEKSGVNGNSVERRNEKSSTFVGQSFLGVDYFLYLLFTNFFNINVTSVNYLI